MPGPDLVPDVCEGMLDVAAGAGDNGGLLDRLDVAGQGQVIIGGRRLDRDRVDSR